MDQQAFKRDLMRKGAPERLAPGPNERTGGASLQPPYSNARSRVPLASDQSISVSKSAADKTPKRRGRQKRALRPAKASAKIRARTSRLLTLLHILLLVLLVFFGVHIWQNVHKALLAPTAAATSFPPAASAAAEPKAATRPLADYRIILEHNLFNVPEEEAALPKKQFDIEKIAPAAKNLGLKLVGTVMADDPWLRRAFIENSRTRKQEAYREGDTTGEFRIKKIMRDKVVIATASGDQLLAVGFDETGKRTLTIQDPQQTSGSTNFPQAAAGEADVGVIESRLKRSQIESGLSEKDYLMKQVQIYPYAEGEQPAGFRLSNIRAGNILLQIGLRSGDVIIGVDGEAVTGPDDADAFFKKLAQGGEITVQVMRRGRPVQIQTNIE